MQVNEKPNSRHEIKILYLTPLETQVLCFGVYHIFNVPWMNADNCGWLKVTENIVGQVIHNYMYNFLFVWNILML